MSDFLHEIDALRSTLSLECIECGIVWWDPAERWRLYTTDDEPAELGLFCPDCAHREFD